MFPSPVTLYQIYASRIVQHLPPMLQASPSLSFSPLAFCLPFLSCIPAQHFISVSLRVPLLEPQLISICMSHKKKKQPTTKTRLKYHLLFYCLKLTISPPHVMCVFPFSSAPVFPWKLAPASYRRVTPRAWAARAGMRGGGGCWEGKCDRQTNQPAALRHMCSSSSSCKLTCLHFKPLTDCSGCKQASSIIRVASFP